MFVTFEILFSGLFVSFSFLVGLDGTRISARIFTVICTSAQFSRCINLAASVGLALSHASGCLACGFVWRRSLSSFHVHIRWCSAISTPHESVLLRPALVQSTKDFPSPNTFAMAYQFISEHLAPAQHSQSGQALSHVPVPKRLRAVSAGPF